MKYDFLIFDLDGTISDPKKGIVRSMNAALKCHGFAERGEEELSTLIGPPLDAAFAALVSTTDSALIGSLVSKFRERYSDVGYSENVLYPGVAEALEQLSSISDIQLGICTSKRVDFAEGHRAGFAVKLAGLGEVSLLAEIIGFKERGRAFTC